MKILQRVFWGFALVSILLVVSAIVSVGARKDTKYSSFEMITPTEISQPKSDVTIFSFTLEEVTDDKSYLTFMSNHEEIEAIIGGKKYEDKKVNSILGHTTGTVFQFIPIPQGTRRIQVKCQNVYPGITQEDYTFYYGDGLHIMKHLLQESLLASIFSLADICLGAAMIIYWLMARTKIHKKKALLNLGTFTALMGIWTLNETNLWKLFVLDGPAGSFVAFIILMMVIIPYCLFINEFFDIKNKTFLTLIVVLSLTNFVICTVLQMANIADYKQTVVTTHMLLASGIIYQMYALYYGYKHRGLDYKVRMNLIGTVFLGSVVVFDMITYYRNIMLMNEAGRVSLLIYAFLLGMAAVRETNEVLDESRKAQAYKELAFVDTLTGVANRNAYHDYLNKKKVEDHNMIITYDLNNLKLCNDTLGHQTGDLYIKDAAAIIKGVFGEYGKCYRIGGDEFCTVIEDARQISIGEYIIKLQKEQEKYRQEHQVEYMKIAVGYAVYDENRDRSLEDTRNRSDEMMYQTKSKMKASNTILRSIQV